MPTPFRHALAALLLSTALGMPSTFAADVAGVHFDDHAAVAGSDTVLNGAGLRTRFMLKVYAIGLYGPKRADTVETFAAVPGPKRIQIVTLRELTAEQFADALLDGIRKNTSDAEFTRLQPRADEFRAQLLALKSTPSGSQIRIEWLPASGTRLSVGNEVRGRDIPGEDFFRALLRIWLGEKPVDGELRNALLGNA